MRRPEPAPARYLAPTPRRFWPAPHLGRVRRASIKSSAVECTTPMPANCRHLAGAAGLLTPSGRMLKRGGSARPPPQAHPTRRPQSRVPARAAPLIYDLYSRDPELKRGPSYGRSRRSPTAHYHGRRLPSLRGRQRYLCALAYLWVLWRRQRANNRSTASVPARTLSSCCGSRGCGGSRLASDLLSL